MFEQLTHDELRDVIVKQLLFLGVMGIGVAAGAHVGVGHIQTACIDAGVLPQPGSTVSPHQMYKSTQCWESAAFLSNLSNGTGIAGAMCLLGGAVIDQYPDRVADTLATLRGQEVGQ